MNTRPFRLVAEHFRDEEEQPMDQEPQIEAQPIQTAPSLPMLRDFQQMAYEMGMRAQQLETQDQLILQDLYHQHESLTIDATAIEDERRRYMDEGNRTFDQRRNVNARQMRAVENQIAHYTWDPMTVPLAQPEPIALQPQHQQKRYGFLGLWKK